MINIIFFIFLIIFMLFNLVIFFGAVIYYKTFELKFLKDKEIDVDSINFNDCILPFRKNNE